MDDPANPENLESMHTPQAIAKRIASTAGHSYLGDFVLGAVDGAVTTFAIVAGAAGAGLSGGVALVLGLANVLADGFSMAAGNFLKARADRQIVDRFRRIEEMHIDEVPDSEREEVRQIYASKGFRGTILEEIVGVITRDRRQWVDTMLTDEWGLQLETPAPLRAASVTMLAFLAAGFVPLGPLLFHTDRPALDVFPVCAALTGVTFFAIGAIRGRVVGSRTLWEGIETVLIGGAAAGLAYAVGSFLEGWAA